MISAMAQLTGSDLLQTGADTLHTLHLLALRGNHVLLGRARLTEDVTVAAEEDVITLVVQRYDLTTLKFGLGREHGVHRLGGEDTERGLEAVEEKLGL